ncbi:MAG UNVERIFIED_CONTAM: hypothetical protein LVT10_04525 [Anaerolineae bacterium]
MLIALADAAGGAFYFIESPEVTPTMPRRRANRFVELERAKPQQYVTERSNIHKLRIAIQGMGNAVISDGALPLGNKTTLHLNFWPPDHLDRPP